jgi:hypothetical protein
MLEVVVPYVALATYPREGLQFLSRPPQQEHGEISFFPELKHVIGSSSVIAQCVDTPLIDLFIDQFCERNGIIYTG